MHDIKNIRKETTDFFPYFETILLDRGGASVLIQKFALGLELRTVTRAHPSALLSQLELGSLKLEL